MNAGNWIGWWRPKNQFGVDLEINHSMVQMISFSSFIWFRVDSEAILIVINTQYPAFHGDHVRLRFFIDLYMWLMPKSESHYSWQVPFWGFCEGWMDLNLSIFYWRWWMETWICPISPSNSINNYARFVNSSIYPKLNIVWWKWIVTACSLGWS